ncbi:hypothetical protein SCOCK_70125 [Actinacidiphila cocklensis]|uniref:Uncharacterized protein n=1 Tax=Actinacidiphila cocklensis TaxID=887465 RepID=A0A9W4GVM9_9ACTN|nr:hypothetical protein SCOCK_70125 [Actinacidiphila cocklensis]
MAAPAGGRVRPVRRPPRRPRRLPSAAVGRTAPPLRARLHPGAHPAVERVGGGGRRLRVRDAGVQLRHQRGAEERDRLPVLRVAVQAGRVRQLRQHLGGPAGGADGQAGRHHAEDVPAHRGGVHPLRGPIHGRRPLRGHRGARPVRQGHVRRAGAGGARPAAAARDGRLSPGGSAGSTVTTANRASSWQRPYLTRWAVADLGDEPAVTAALAELAGTGSGAGVFTWVETALEVTARCCCGSPATWSSPRSPTPRGASGWADCSATTSSSASAGAPARDNASRPHPGSHK